MSYSGRLFVVQLLLAQDTIVPFVLETPQVHVVTAARRWGARGGRREFRSNGVRDGG